MTVSMRVGVGGDGLGNGERAGNVAFEELHGSDVCGSREISRGRQGKGRKIISTFAVRASGDVICA